MARYLKKKEEPGKYLKENKIPAVRAAKASLRRVRRNMYRQGALALLTIVLTIVIMFAMTSAWYTNIVQTSGLVFEAEAWGFDGTITVNEGSVLASPGDNGVVRLTVENNSDAISAISVNISKAGMKDEMQRRLFFYVDTYMNRNGETMERVYLNRYEGYTYNVFGQGKLMMTDQVSNAPVIKWEWVYDVLGYYVLAQPYEIQTVNEIKNEDGTVTTEKVTTTQMSIREYLRPIVYDFDEATTVINSDGDVVSVDIDTVDGSTTPEEFLKKLSKNDGYEGTIQSDDKQSFGNYYAVDVDENGYGVYAYLCNYSEIKMATAYDTKLGELAQKKEKGEELLAEDAALLSHKVTLTLSAQKNQSATINVNTLGALRTAIDLGTANIIQLSSNITFAEGETLTIYEDANVMLDLNGYTVTSMDGTAIKAEPGSSLTVMNGAIINNTEAQTGDSAKTYGIFATGAEVVLSDVDVNDFQYGIYVGDNEDDNELDSRVYMVGCVLEAEDYAVFVSGNGVLSEQKSQLIIENSKLSSEGIVITGNGNSSGNGRWGTDIQIINSTITASKNETGVQGIGIYHPQKNSTMMVYNSTVEGYSGIAIKGGSVSIVDSIITGTGAYQEPSHEGSGFTDTGDAVYIDTNYGYEILLEISKESKLRHKEVGSMSLRVFDVDAPNVSIQIESGTFDEEQPEEYIKRGSVQCAVENTFVVNTSQ